jgi:hypothetical protein
VSKKPEVLEKVLKTMIEGISIFKTNKEKSISVWRKYLRGASDDILEESYQSTLGELERVPVPSLPVIKSGLDVLSLQYPQAKQTGPSLIIDPTIVTASTRVVLSTRFTRNRNKAMVAKLIPGEQRCRNYQIPWSHHDWSSRDYVFQWAEGQDPKRVDRQKIFRLMAKTLPYDQEARLLS